MRRLIEIPELKKYFNEWKNALEEICKEEEIHPEKMDMKTKEKKGQELLLKYQKIINEEWQKIKHKYENKE